MGVLDRAVAERLAPPTGLHTILVHGYAGVDLDEVAAAVRRAVEGYGHTCGRQRGTSAA